MELLKLQKLSQMRFDNFIGHGISNIIKSHLIRDDAMKVLFDVIHIF